jgi:hypothetical protein
LRRSPSAGATGSCNRTFTRRANIRGPCPRHQKAVLKCRNSPGRPWGRQQPTTHPGCGRVDGFTGQLCRGNQHLPCAD